MLATRAAWEKYGAAVFRGVLRWGEPRPLQVVFLTLAGRSGSAELLDRVHLVFATVLLELAGVAADAGDHDRLVSLLTAVLKLDPPPPIVQKLHDLRRREGLPGRAVERIEMGASLFKSKVGRAATFDGLFEALRALPPAESPPLGAPR
jgi:hypothetical protein